MVTRSKASFWLALVALLLLGVAAPLQADPTTPGTRPEEMYTEAADRPPWLPVGEPQPAPEAAPAGPETVPWSKLVFESYRHYNWEIYRANADGSGQTRLTFDPAIDIHPDLRPGCGPIAFASTRDGDYEIYTMNLDGSGLSQVTHNDSDDVNPDWSPDGSKIAFEAYRDGQAEIYVMSADGAGQMRLTDHSSLEGQPDWSPDGGRIAYASGNRIWVMNADGSSQEKRSNQSRSENPFWSPDGSQIVYDAAPGGVKWQELWLMNADGTDQRRLYGPQYRVEALAGGWSTDGRYVAFTRLVYVYSGGTYYVSAAYLRAWDTQAGGYIDLGSGSRDWGPSWASCDLTAPSSNVNPLPAESPCPFAVSWSGSDSGGSGLVNYDVQVRVGSAGAWTDWRTATTATSASYTGQGGTTYYFRSRGRDGAGHVEAWPAGPDASTRVESQPPMSYVNRLPVYSSTPLTVTWQGNDPGGSGIACYDVQYKDLTAQGGWADWQHLTPAATALFTGTAGHTFAFRSSATDRAGNAEPWQAGEGDAWTTLYTWKVEGTAIDNAGTPLAGVAVATVPGAFVASASNAAGGYYAYVADSSSTYTTTWVKPGYGALPDTPLNGAADTQVELLLPPADNGVQNWGFESGSLSPGWQAAGSPVPTVVSEDRHTGGSAIRLGCAAIGGCPEMIQMDRAMPHREHQVTGRADGSIHIVWSNWSAPGSSEDLFYIRRQGDGTWLPKEQVTEAASDDGNPRLALDSAGRVHVVWQGYGDRERFDVFYSQRQTGSVWSSPEEVSSVAGTDSAAFPELAVDAMGQIHVIWIKINEWADFDLYHRVRHADGTWSVEQLITMLDGSSYPQIVADEGGLVHLAWDYFGDIYYAVWDSAGGWSTPVNLSSSVAGSSHRLPQAVIDGAGTVHVFWTSCCFKLVHASHPAGGVWSHEVVDAAVEGSHSPVVVVDSSDVLHLLWQDTAPGSAMISYSRSLAGGGWSAPQQVSGPAEATSPAGMLDSAGRMHAVWRELTQNGREVFYRAQITADTWSQPMRVSCTPDSSIEPSVAVDLSGRPDVIWLEDRADGYSLNRSELTGLEVGDSGLSQTLALSSGLHSPALGFAYRLEGASAASGTWFGAEVQDGLTRTVVLSTAQNTAGWTWQRFDLGSQVGPTVTLTFRVHEVAGEPCARVYLDEVSVGSAYPDLWLSGCTRATLPGEAFRCRLFYGNQAAVAAAGARITHTLPAGLHLVGASPPPITTTPALVWELGDLAGRSGPEPLLITATVAPTATLWTMLSGPIEIGSTTAELEAWNNSSILSVFVGQRAYLPLVVKR